MTTFSKLLTGAAVAALISATPIDLTVRKDDGGVWLSVRASTAFAESGKGSEGDGRDDDSSGSGSGSDDDSSSDDDDHDNSGSGSYDDDDDDDDDEDNSGRSKPRVPGGSGCDDPGDVSEHPECSGGTTQTGSTGGTDEGSTQRIIAKVEVSATGIEIKYSDGSKEEIENGVYERKNTSNRTVEKRRATGADVARMRALADRITVANVPSKSADDQGVRKIEITGNNIEVTYNNGWKEEIEFGRYELKDRFNRTVVERPATDADRDRLLEVVNG